MDDQISKLHEIGENKEMSLIDIMKDLKSYGDEIISNKVLKTELQNKIVSLQLMIELKQKEIATLNEKITSVKSTTIYHIISRFIVILLFHYEFNQANLIFEFIIYIRSK